MKRIVMNMLIGAVLSLSPMSLMSHAQEVVPDVELDQAIRSDLNLTGYSLQRLDVDRPAPDLLLVTLQLGGLEHTLHLRPNSVRAPGFRLLLETAPGQFEEIEAPPERTWRGIVGAVPGSDARAGFVVDDLEIMIRMPDGAIWSAQPLSSIVPGSTLHVVYRAEDMAALPFGCGVSGATLTSTGTEPDSPFSARSLFTLELALDADYEYFHDKFGDNITGTTNDMNNIMNLMNQTYESDLDMTVLVSEMIIRTIEADPYPDCNPGAADPAATMLGQFRTYWEANHAEVHRDAAMLFTGKLMVLCDGNAIGIAYTPGMCNDFAYSVCESRYGGNNLAGRVALHAHELGHNLSALHCAGASCHIMCPVTGGCGGLGGFPPIFGTGSINTITNYAGNQPCIEMAALPDLLVETWPDALIDVSRWASNIGGVVNGLGLNEPSPPNSLELDGTDQIESVTLPLGDLFAQGTGYVSFWIERRGPDPSDALTVEIFSALLSYDTLVAVSGTGGNETLYTFHEVAVPFFGYHDLATLRFTSASDSSGDDWMIDDIRVSLYCRADLTRDQIINTSDFLEFLNLFSAFDQQSDWNRDGLINTSDFLGYLNTYNSGCPS